jgi:hypothetical protein
MYQAYGIIWIDTVSVDPIADQEASSDRLGLLRIARNAHARCAGDNPVSAVSGAKAAGSGESRNYVEVSLPEA